MRAGFSWCLQATNIFLLVALGPNPAEAHAFGQRYDLPLPLNLFLYGAALIVLLSFLVSALFARTRSGPVTCQWHLARVPPTICLLSSAFLKGVGLSVFGLVLIAGFFGSNSATNNITPLIVWVYGWVGFLFVTAFLANLWPWLNPWRTLYAWADHLLGRTKAAPNKQAQSESTWLTSLALFGLLLVAWLEQTSAYAESPRGLAVLILIYSFITWVGMFFFGPDRWLEDADPFSRLFQLFGSFAPLGRGPDGGWVLRLPAFGLLGQHCRSLAGVAFIFAIIATVTFDGLSETPFWQAILTFVAESGALRPTLLWLQEQGVNLLALMQAFGLVTTALVFFLAFTLTCFFSRRLGDGASIRQTLCRFAPSLLPIAIAYHLAHYLSFLLLAGQMGAPLASDPLGFGWNLFGTRDLTVDLGVIGAREVWYLALATIVLGHVFSVVLAHLEAQRLFAKPKQVLLSQLPILILMVAFTMVSLSILAQPIVQETG